MRPPVSAIEPCSRGVLIFTRGCSASACSRVAAAGAGGAPGAAGAPGGAGAVAGRSGAGAGVAGAVWRRCRRRRRCRVEFLEQELKADQNADREHDREQEIALFHCGLRTAGSAARVDAAPGRSRCRPRDGSAAAGAAPARAAPRPVPLDRFGRIVRAARIKAAGGRQERRRQQLIGADQRLGSPDPARRPGRRHAPSRLLEPAGAAVSLISTLLVAGAAGASARAGLPLDLPQAAREIGDQVGIAPLAGAGPGDQHIIGPRPAVRANTSAAAARSRRLARLRTTALPTLRLAVKPTRTTRRRRSSGGRGAACKQDRGAPPGGGRRLHGENRRGS